MKPITSANTNIICGAAQQAQWRRWRAAWRGIAHIKRDEVHAVCVCVSERASVCGKH
jgi:hypothetical protein